MAPDAPVVVKAFADGFEKTNLAALLEELDGQNAWYLYWLSQAYKENGNADPYDQTLNRMRQRIEINDIDYALAWAASNS